MVPPTGPLSLNVEAISGICGSISIACWVVVFSPQIIENFRRGSADGLSLQFIIVWLVGDIFNILGAVLQGVLPTMIILAVYYTIADIVLLGQCFYYRGFTWHDDVVPPKRHKSKRVAEEDGHADDDADCHRRADERTALLASSEPCLSHTNPHHAHSRRPSWAAALSPAVPFAPILDDSECEASSAVAAPVATAEIAAPPPPDHHRRTSHLQAVAFNAFAILMVCAAGVAGWYLSSGHKSTPPPDDNNGNGGSNDDDPLTFSVWGQIFGYFCAMLYLGSRLPQLLLNWRRQSTEGVSMLFFLFACLGNLTYVLSIFAHEEHADLPPAEARRRYGRYLLVNLSWLAGSLGTLLLDMGIFIQFFLYRHAYDSDYDSDADYDSDYDDVDGQTEVATADGNWSRDTDGRETYQSFDQPILQRNMSHYG